MSSGHSIRIPADLYEQMAAIAEKEDRTLTSILRRMLGEMPLPGSPQYERTVDHFLNSASKVRVLDRWRKVGGGK